MVNYHKSGSTIRLSSVMESCELFHDGCTDYSNICAI